MSLTQKDLSSIGQIVEEKVKTQVKEQLIKQLKPIKKTLAAIRKDLSWTMLKYDTRLNHLEKHLVHPPGRADL